MVGLVSHGPTLCGTEAGAVYTNVSNYLDWIQNVKVKDVVSDFESRSNVPYEKLDNDVLSAMLEITRDALAKNNLCESRIIEENESNTETEEDLQGKKLLSC